MDLPDKTRRLDAAALFKRLFSSSPDGILVVDGEGRIIEVNPQIELLFGYARAELLGSLVEILIPERFRSVHTGHRMAYSDQPTMRPMGTGLDLYGRRKDGSEFPIDIMLSPVETAGERLVLGVVRDVTERKRLEKEMRQLALSDPLTALGNYRRLQEAFETETKWSRRTGRPFALLLLDLDGLKKINDTYGHAVGSRALVRIANVLRAECRAIDTAARHGGDEFAVILPDTNAEGAKELASRLASPLANDAEDPPVSFSYGVAVYAGNQETLDHLLAVADRALYAMKRSKASKHITRASGS
jgi:diguanylate cyclase (GGDEF)-like protein/PAS domain S-box-containing protein